jgi:hypothetical protein
MWGISEGWGEIVVDVVDKLWDVVADHLRDVMD